MLTAFQCFLLILTVFGTSILSGVFGVAGGLILMGVLASLLPVPLAMTAHGFVQLIANGTRFFSLLKHVDWKSSRFYLGGAVIAAGVFWSVLFTPSKAVLFLILGAVPLIAMIPWAPHFDFQKPWHGFLCGLVNTAAHLTAGVSGPVLDIFFVNSKMNRYQIIATKSFTQIFGHALKISYFASMASALTSLPLWLPISLSLMAILGTHVGGWALRQLTEVNFRVYLKRLLFAMGCIYLVRAAFEL